MNKTKINQNLTRFGKKIKRRSLNRGRNDLSLNNIKESINKF
jgi:hypothetical protein